MHLCSKTPLSLGWSFTDCKCYPGFPITPVFGCVLKHCLIRRFSHYPSSLPMTQACTHCQMNPEPENRAKHRRHVPRAIRGAFLSHGSPVRAPPRCLAVLGRSSYRPPGWGGNENATYGPCQSESKKTASFVTLVMGRRQLGTETTGAASIR